MRVQSGQKEQPDGADRGPDYRKDLVAPRPRDQLAGADRARQQPRHERHELQARGGWAEAADHLLEEGEVGEGPEEGEPHHEAHRAGDDEDAVAEELEWKHRLGRPMLDEDEGAQGRGRDDTQPDDERGVPGVCRAAERCPQHQGAQADAEENRAQVVDAVMPAFADAGQGDREDDQRQNSQGNVDVEDPAPAPVSGEETADQRPGHAGHAEDGAEEPEVAAPVPRGDHVPDRRLSADQQPATPEPLDRPEGDQLAHALRLSAEPRADQEDDQGPLEDHLAPVEIAELPVERRDHRDREQVRGDHPGEVVEAPEIPDDRRQSGGDDRLIERRQQHRQHQRPDDDQNARPRGCLRRDGCDLHR
jgi:hypothetical protein